MSLIPQNYERIKVVIVDDERLARTKIRRFLEQMPDVEIIAECSNGIDALELLHNENSICNLMFLDIQMPDLGGLQVVQEYFRYKEELQKNKKNIVESNLENVPNQENTPLFIFITAFEEYAIQAFRENALDYLVKPFDFERFELTMGRVRKMLRLKSAAQMQHESVQGLILQREEFAGNEMIERFVVRTRGKITLVDVQEVDWIESDGNYAILHVGEVTHLIRETLSSLENRLPAREFIRIHRSVIVKISFLTKIELSQDGTYQAVLKDSTRSFIGPTYREAVRKVLGLV
jgi:two-component system, LytTR family, response regulator